MSDDGVLAHPPDAHRLALLGQVGIVGAVDCFVMSVGAGVLNASRPVLAGVASSSAGGDPRARYDGLSEALRSLTSDSDGARAEPQSAP